MSSEHVCTMTSLRFIHNVEGPETPVGESETLSLHRCSCEEHWLGTFNWPNGTTWKKLGKEGFQMAAKTFWTREQAGHLVESMLPAFSEGTMYNLSEAIDRTIVCGDMRRDPNVTAVKHLCIVGVIKELGNGIELNLPDIRGKVKSNIQSVFPGSPIRNFKLYDFVELPDGSGNVSWLVVPQRQAGAATLHATGPVMFCKMVEMFADSVGLVFGASGIKKGDEKLETPDEQSVFREIGANFVTLNERETARYLDPV